MSDAVNQRVALVTGANKASAMRRRGSSRGEASPCSSARATSDAGRKRLRDGGADARFLRLDVTDARTHDAARRRIDESFGKLDILINNAGIAGDYSAKPSEITSASPREVFDTNFFGAVAVTQALLPLVRRSDAERIVSVSSGLGSLAQNSDPGWEFYEAKPLAYNSSKTALNAFTVILAHEMKETAIKVNAADPGYTATDLNAHQGHRTVEQGASIIVELATLPADGATGGFFDDRGAVPW